MAKPITCGLCKAEMRKGEKLKSHWRELHPEEYAKRQRWLGESEARIRAVAIIAQEGMKNCTDKEYTPSGREGDE